MTSNINSNGTVNAANKSRQPVRGKEIDLLDLASYIWSKVLYVIVAALVGGIAMLAYTVFMVTPQYTSTTTMYVNTGSLALGSLASSITSSELKTSEQLVDLYITILQSRETLEEVSQESGLGYSYDTMKGLVSAVSGTTKSDIGTAPGVFTVVVTDSDPNEAELIANTIAEVLPTRISDIVDGTSTRIIEYAIVAAQRSSPSYTKNLAMGLLVGAAISAGVLVVLYLIETSNDTVVHNNGELSELFPNIPVLATILDMRLTDSNDYSYRYYYEGNYNSDGDDGKKKEKKSSKKKNEVKEDKADE